jgi:hypothetical protein
MNQSAVTALRTGRWRKLSVDTVAALAAVSVVVDVLTTTHILYSPNYWEGNLLLAQLADVDSALALAVFTGYALASLAVAWLSLGWLSTAVGSTIVTSMGFSGLSNLVLFATDASLYVRLGLPHPLTIHLIQPAIGFLVGVAIARRRGSVPWREVVAVAVIGIAMLTAGEFTV